MSYFFTHWSLFRNSISDRGIHDWPLSLGCGFKPLTYRGIERPLDRQKINGNLKMHLNKAKSQQKYLKKNKMFRFIRLRCSDYFTVLRHFLKIQKFTLTLINWFVERDNILYREKIKNSFFDWGTEELMMFIWRKQIGSNQFSRVIFSDWFFVPRHKSISGDAKTNPFFYSCQVFFSPK